MKLEWFALLLLIIGLTIFACDKTLGRDRGQFANSSPEMRKWFQDLKSGKGPCCSDADGTALSDVDWESNGTHYRVHIENQWIDVPDDAVLPGPNLAGKTMVWPVYNSPLGGPLNITIRCFIPGSMT